MRRHSYNFVSSLSKEKSGQKIYNKNNNNKKILKKVIKYDNIKEKKLHILL